MNPRTKLTPADVTANIKSATYTRLPSGKAIVCEMTLTNGFVVHGISALVDLDNYDEEMGKQAAFNKAKDQAWAHLAFALQSDIANGSVESKHDELVTAYIGAHNNQAVTLPN